MKLLGKLLGNGTDWAALTKKHFAYNDKWQTATTYKMLCEKYAKIFCAILSMSKEK